MADAGRIVIIPKGEYKSNITYERLDAVEYNNNGYIALKTVTGITPTNDGTNWALYVKGTPVDSELSTTSTNAIQNKIVTAEISALKKENTQQSTEMLDIKMLGWSVPRVCPIQNEVNGNKFVQKVGRIDLGEQTWSYSTENGYVQATTPDNLKLPSANSEVANIYTINYETVSDSAVYNHKKDKIIGINTGGFIKAYDSSYTDASTFKSAMQGQYLYYELANYVTKTIDGNEIGETVSDVRKETTTNVCPFPMTTSTVNKVTCTNNNDGTFTLNGTASDLTTFVISGNAVMPLLKKFAGKKMKLTGVEHGSTSTYYIQFWSNVGTYAVSNDRNGIEVSMPDISNITSAAAANIAIIVRSGATMNNEIVKPMLTTNLSATYDDFVPYTGNTGSLNWDVASLLKRIQALESQFASSTSELCSDAIDDLASVVSTQDEAIDELATIVTESEEK